MFQSYDKMHEFIGFINEDNKYVLIIPEILGAISYPIIDNNDFKKFIIKDYKVKFALL